MLTKLTEAEYERYAPWAYELAVSQTHGSFPTYRDGIKTREEFMERARRGFEDEEVLLFRHDGQVCGWIQWYAIPEENYAMTVSFLVESHAQEAVAAFADRVAGRYPGVTLDIGMDAQNAQVCRALEESGFVLLESSVNHTLFFDRYQPELPSEQVWLMKPGDEPDFRRLHCCESMYWTAERILADRQNWRVYLYRQGERPVGVLCCRMLEGWPEVFSIEWEEDTFAPEIYRGLMAACLRDVKADGCTHMTYFEEEEQALPVLAALGFEQAGQYRGYRREWKGE